MLLNILNESPNIHIFHENDANAYDAFCRLHSDEDTQTTIRKTNKKFIVFKPLNDTQNANYFYKLHPNAKIIWAYRGYKDSVNSMVRWRKNAPNEIVQEIASGVFTKELRKIYKEKINPKTLATLKYFCKKDLSSEEGAALFWYMRNVIYWDLGFNNNSQVLLCKYEDIVTDPKIFFKRIFTFIDCEFDDKFFSKVNARSIGKNPFPSIDEEINKVCEEMLAKLDEKYREQLSAAELCPSST
jgi:hypothetical protein